MKEGRLSAITGRFDPLISARLHDGMELLTLHVGEASLSFEGKVLSLRTGHLALYWGAIPRVALGPFGGVCTVAQIPLERFMSWRLPTTLTSSLLSGQPSCGLEGDAQAMAVLRWEEDLASGDPFVSRAAELEVQAAVLRMARKREQWQPGDPTDRSWKATAAWLLANLHRPVSAAEAGIALARHPTHLMRAFRRGAGMTMGEYLLLHRLARAKRLLIETSLTTGAVALEAGFGSERRFFEAFREREGMTPGAYRKRSRSWTGP